MYAHMPIIRDILYGAASRGARVNELCDALQLSVSDLNDSGRAVPFETAYRSWELALAHTGDPLLGLHLGETSTPSILGLIGHLMQSSPDLLTAYQQVCRHAALATDMFHYAISIGRDETVLTYKPAKLWITVSQHSARQAVEQAMAGTLNVFYLLSGRKVTPLQTTFAFSRPRLFTEYERVFGAVRFNEKQNALRFRTSDLNLPVASYDQSLFALFDKIVREKITARKRNSSFSDTVRNVLADEFRGQIVPAAMVAGKLNMSLRTFQRKLTEEGTSFRELSSRLRKELATMLLKQDDVRVREVARMLGYSEASALRKALRN